MQKHELYFVRHGMSTAQLDVENRLICGHSADIPLSEEGKMQAGRLGNFIRDQYENETIVPDFVYASNAVRAQQTARFAIRKAGLAHHIKVSPELREMGHGDNEGKFRAAVYTPEVVERIHEEGKDFRLPGGESMNDVADRMIDWLNRYSLRNINQATTAYVFSHRLAIACAVSRIEGMEHEQIRKAIIPNVSLTKISGNRHNWEVEYMGQSAEALTTSK